MPEKTNRKQQPTNPATAPKKPGGREVPPWMSDDTRVVFSEERNNEDG